MGGFFVFLRRSRGLLVDEGSPYSNMVYLNLVSDAKVDAAKIIDIASKQNVLLDCENARRFRLVTHYWVDDKAVDKVIQVFKTAME